MACLTHAGSVLSGAQQPTKNTSSQITASFKEHPNEPLASIAVIVHIEILISWIRCAVSWLEKKDYVSLKMLFATHELNANSVAWIAGEF